MMRRVLLGSLVSLALAAGVPRALAADAVSAFYQGKALSIYVAGSIGGPYDLRARMIEPYLRKHMPGTPTVVVQAMPGAGGQRAANSLYNVLPKDGTAIAMVLPTIAFNQAVEMSGIQYDARRFRYIGSLEPLDTALVVSPQAPARTLADSKRMEVALGSSGRASPSWIVPALMNRYLGTKFRIVMGYSGMSDILLAVDRGEVGGIAVDWYAISSARPDWQPGKSIFGIAKSGLKRTPELPDVPTLMELAESEEKRQVLQFYALSNALGVALIAPPEIPADRLAALQTALDRTLADPEFRAEAKARGFNIQPTAGAELETIVARTLATPREAINQMKDLLDLK